MSICVYHPLRDVLSHDFSHGQFDGFFKPATDIFETENEFVVKVNLPGFKKDNIIINATGNDLEIKAEIKDSSSDASAKDNENWVARHIERVNRNFIRKIRFSKLINPQNAKVNYEDGVLTINLPIKPEAKKVSLQVV